MLERKISHQESRRRRRRRRGPPKYSVSQNPVFGLTESGFRGLLCKPVISNSPRPHVLDPPTPTRTRPSLGRTLKHGF